MALSGRYKGTEQAEGTRGMVHAVAAPRKNSRKKRQAARLPLPGLPTRKAGCPDTDPPWAQNKHL